MAGGGGPGDAVLVSAVIGAERLGDFVDKAILEGREALALGGCFAGGV
jgi:ATP sulfurylase